MQAARQKEGGSAGDIADAEESNTPPDYSAHQLLRRLIMEEPALEAGPEQYSPTPARLNHKLLAGRQPTAVQIEPSVHQLEQPVITGRIVARPEISLAEAPEAWTSPASDGQAAQQAEAVVHVTIGRIEVRAAPHPAAPKHEVSMKKPPLSLGEYLQRYGGKG